MATDATPNNPKYRYYKNMFYSGALFNWSVAILWFFAFDKMYALMGGGPVPQAPLFDLFLQLISMIIFLFGCVYFSIARNPDSPSGPALALVGLLGKLLFVFFFFGYAIAGLTPWPLAALVSVDLLYAILFWEYARHQSTVANTN